MNLQELRIGNHVLDEDGYVVKVQKIEVNRFVSVSSENIEYPSNVYGIEIYEMLFEEHPDFKKDSQGNYWINLQTHYLKFIYTKEYWYPVYVQIPELSSEDEQQVGLKRIKYIHELQNLYFVLTGDELEL